MTFFGTSNDVRPLHHENEIDVTLNDSRDMSVDELLGIKNPIQPSSFGNLLKITLILNWTSETTLVNNWAWLYQNAGILSPIMANIYTTL